MLEKEPKIDKEQKGEEEKIFFSEANFACFACGEKIEKSTKTCPYCGTQLNKSQKNNE